MSISSVGFGDEGTLRPKTRTILAKRRADADTSTPTIQSTLATKRRYIETTRKEAMKIFTKSDLHDGTAEDPAANTEPIIVVLPPRARNGLKTAATDTGANKTIQWCNKYQDIDKTTARTYIEIPDEPVPVRVHAEDNTQSEWFEVIAKLDSSTATLQAVETQVATMKTQVDRQIKLLKKICHQNEAILASNV